MRKLRIGVMGSAECDAASYAMAEEVGRLIASQDAILICGGRTGIMEAAAKAASTAGAVVVGILPSEDEGTANRYVHIPILTGLGNARNAINALTSHAIIAIAGGYGTLSEIALALKVGTPVVGLETWIFSAPQSSAPPPHFHTASNPKEAVQKAFELARARVVQLGLNDYSFSPPEEE